MSDLLVHRRSHKEPTTTHGQAPESDAADSKPFESLYPHEVGWRDRQLFLQSKGYMLRPRLRPGWTPSWKAGGLDPSECEDYDCLPLRPHLVDATKMEDGNMVYIKRVKTGDQESTIARMLYSEDIRHDPRNHSVPVLDHFQDDMDSSISYLVMPFLRPINSPTFTTVGEVVDFVDQILEGLVFMHEKGVAHRDCSEPNLMMDATAMYPLGFHPVSDMLLPDAKTPVYDSIIPRSVAGVRYYFVDYGISTYSPPGQPFQQVVGRLGRDQQVPELSDTVPYDPFAVDIFTIGHLLHTVFHRVYSNVDFLPPVIRLMVQRDPSRRVRADQALLRWNYSRQHSISTFQMYRRLKRRDEGLLLSMFFDTFDLIGICARVVVRVVRGR